MRKDRLIDMIAQDAGLPEDQARDCLEALGDQAAEVLLQGEPVPLPGLGSLRLHGLDRSGRFTLRVVFIAHGAFARRLKGLNLMDNPETHAALARILHVDPAEIDRRVTANKRKLVHRRRQGGTG